MNSFSGRFLIAAGAVLWAACSGEPRPPAGAAAPKLSGADVVLVTVSALRADAVDGEAPAPLLARLAAAGRVFSSAHTASVATLPAHATLLTGRWPHQHGVRDERGFALAAGVPTLATRLAGEGYATAAFVSAELLAAGHGLERGFEVYDDRFAVPAGGLFAAERAGRETVAAALEWWRSRAGERRFLWVHLFEPHFPYRPAPDGGDPYLGEVAAAADALAPLLEPHLDGREPPALVVLTADHGEARGEHGEHGHGLYAYEPTLRVPLVLWHPGVDPGRDTRAASHVDLVPTVLAALDLGASGTRDLPGLALLEPAPEAPRTLYFEALTPYFERRWAPLRGVLHGHRKYVDLPRPELYDLAADPDEKRNLLAGGGRRSDLRDLLPPGPGTGPLPPGSGTWAVPPKHDYEVADDPKSLLELDRELRRAGELAAAGRLAEAEALARQVCEMRPEMPAGHALLAALLRQQDRAGEALEVLEQAYALGAVSEALHQQLGRALVEAGRASEAVELLEPWVQAHGGAPDPRTLEILTTARGALASG